MIRTTIARSLALLLAAAAPALARAQALDICGCTSGPSLGHFASTNEATYPPGTVRSNADIVIPLPADGVLVFDSFTVGLTPGGGFWARVWFAPNAANTPVTLLSRGDVTIGGSSELLVNGGDGTAPTGTTFSVPGRGGPGGYAGGRGAHFALDGSTVGGAGIGPAGGTAGAPGSGGGGLLSVPELRPLRGGSGGGGGGNSAISGCAGGAGGGGAGAILIASNTTISVAAGAIIRANGGTGSNRLNGGCDSGGSGGSAGAIRLVANAITGSGWIEARGGSYWTGAYGADGVIRMESFTNSFGPNVFPVAARLSSPGPLVNPFQPRVAFTALQGTAITPTPIGFRNEIDLILPAPGVVELDVETRDVPAGTDVEIVVKPRLGGGPTTQRITLAPGDCASGVCSVDATFDLAPGTYIAEARATFEVP